MIYLNNKLRERVKDPKNSNYDKKFDGMWDEFEKNFSHHLTQIGTINPMKPIIVKYREDLTQPDKDNPGKFLSPASISLNFEAKAMLGTGMAQIRYSPEAALMDNNGHPKFPMSRIAVERRMSILDVDLAFFLWAFSEEMAANGRGIQGNNLNFQIENPEAEAREYARQKREESIFTTRLFAEVGEGGLSDKMIVYGAKAMGIIHADQATSVNKLRQDIERLANQKKELKAEFVKATDVTPSELDESYTERINIIKEAIHYQLIANVTFKSSYFLCDGENNKPKTELYNYKEAKKANPKTQTSDLLFLYLEEKHPEMINDLETRLNAIKEAKKAEEQQLATA